MNRATLNHSLLNASLLNATRLSAAGTAAQPGKADLTADLLAEDGSFLLTEDSGKILLETNTRKRTL